MAVSQGRSHSGQGSNSSLIGDFNVRVILSALRRGGPASKADLSRMVGLTHNATGVIARRLEQGGLVRAVGKRHGERGQPATILELNPEGAFSIGVRLDRTMIETVLVDLRGRVLAHDRLDHLPEPEAAMAHLAGRVSAMAAMLPTESRARITGIGVAMPYNLDSWLSELDLPAAHFRRWGGFDLQAALSRATGLSVVLENDASAAAVGELIYGHGRAIADFLYVFIGPAVGGGVVLGGDYFRGQARNAGDLGVVPVAASRLASAPSGPTILMARASLGALRRHLRHAGACMAADGPSCGTEWAACIEDHPALYGEWAQDAAEALSVPVLTAAHLLDVRHVILGGDLPQGGLATLATRLVAAMSGIVAESRTEPSVLCGLMGTRAASVGAASLPLHDNFSPVRDGLTGLAEEMRA